MSKTSSYRRSSGSTVPSSGSTVGAPSVRRSTITTAPSSIPVPTSDSLSAPEFARKRQTRKDDALRKKLDQELGKKGSTTRTHGSTRAVQGTVGSLRPSPALTLPDTAMVVDAARVMAAKRADAVLVIDANEQTLVGIMTDKDLAFRVVAEGLDIHTPIAQVMTKNPYCVTTDTNATEALNKMVSGGFRHLPCLNSDGDVVGLLDITKCLYEALEKLEKAHKSSKQLADALQGMQTEWAQPANPELQSYISVMKEKMSSPDLNVILDEHHGVAEIQSKTSVREASRVMKQWHSTASLIVENGRITGIFTTKDIVVRVLAAGLEPGMTSVIRVMTPHPDTVQSNMTILDALKKMHDNHYLHLPVVDEHGQMAGLVDVLQVSFAMLSQMSTIQGDGAATDSQGPVWNRFWESTFAREETGSEISASDVRSGFMPPPSDTNYGGGSINSSTRLGSPPNPLGGVEEDKAEITFKFQESSGQAHRFASSTRSFADLHSKVAEKMGGLEAGLDIAISYCDEEGDQVLILKDEDLIEAVQMAYRNQWPLIRLTVTASSKNQKNTSAPGSVVGAPAPVPAPVTAAPAAPVTTGVPVGVPVGAAKPAAGSSPLDAVAGMNPVLVSGAIGLGVGVVLMLAFSLMRK
ncbi:hypothetical protein BGX34_003408 [Mortierella sp. NVP85]|nr:hypothetical protein BGX34_003408 [Mortierella sp. NVP85]